MWLRRQYAASAVLFILASSAAQSQTSPPDSRKSIVTFKTKAQLVLLDVVVTTSKGEPISGLHKQDFQVTEDGKPQNISLFEEHKGAPPSVELPPMPPNVFTNYPLRKTLDSVNVLLLDWLNTQPQDQAYVREQTIRFLKTSAPGTSLAVFTLGTRLHMVQGFTTDPAVLLAELENKKTGPDVETSRLLPSAVQDAAEQDVIRLMTMNQASPAGIDAARDEMAATSALHADERIRITLHALQQLARYLSGITGRKNVIWFSGSFPISIFPGTSVAREYQSDLRLTADLLTPERVAIYPVSAAGLAADATYFAEYEKGPPLEEENSKRAVTQIAMEELANDTGGKAFYNTSGLKDALAHASDSGSHFYGLAYIPSDKHMDGKYRTIHVKVPKDEYKLAYRRGYYAEGPGTAPELDPQTPTDPLLPLMAFGLPESTQIVYKLRVLPAEPQPAADAPHAGSNSDLHGPVTRYAVEYAISVDDLTLKTTSDGIRQGGIEVMLVAYDLDGKPVNFVVRKFGIALQPKVYAGVKKVGLQLRQEIDVPRGNVYLRTGVYDLTSAGAGTLGIPLSAVSQAAATK